MYFSNMTLLLIELALFLQLSQSPMDARPSYDYIQGANVEPTTFYNIGDLELQDNLARIWWSTNCIFLVHVNVMWNANTNNFVLWYHRVDIGTVEPLLLNVLINALTQISSEYDLHFILLISYFWLCTTKIPYHREPLTKAI